MHIVEQVRQYIMLYQPVNLCGCVPQVAAACCGLYGVRPSQGVVPGDGVSMASGRLENVAWVAADPDVLCRVGQAMNLPGGAHSFRRL